MNNDSYITPKTKELVKQIVLYTKTLVQKKIIYEAYKNEYDRYNAKRDSLEQHIREYYPRYYYGNNRLLGSDLSHSASESMALDSILNERRSIKLEMSKIWPKVTPAHNEYITAINTLDSFFNKLEESSLMGVAQYLDIIIDVDCTTQNAKYILRDKIRESLITDFEILFNHNKELSEDESYRGTISLIEKILEERNSCDLKIKKYNKCKEISKNLGKKYDEITDSINEKETRINELQTMFISRIFKYNELRKLRKNLMELEETWEDLYLDSAAYEGVLKELSKEKSVLCYRYIDFCNRVDLIIDRLGEKSLKELTQKLNLNIVTTDDNYFDESEEMRKALKDWFQNENKKMSKEIDEVDIYKIYEEDREIVLNKQLKK